MQQHRGILIQNFRGLLKHMFKNSVSLAEADISLLSLGSQSGFPYQTWCRGIAQLSEGDCNS